MEPDVSPNPTVVVTGLTNQEFLARYAQPGRVGLSGGTTPIDLAICRAERHLDDQKRWGVWSHAFLFEGVRTDGYNWVIESDLELHHKHIRLGVQENRVTKFYNEKMYTTLAVLDFGLSQTQATALISEGLELVSSRTRYSLAELLGTLIALRKMELRGRDNLMARERSLFCSAFVQHLFRKTGIDLTPGVHGKHTTPEDISRTLVPHTTYILQHDSALKKITRIRRRVRARIRRIKTRLI